MVAPEDVTLHLLKKKCGKNYTYGFVIKGIISKLNYSSIETEIISSRVFFFFFKLKLVKLQKGKLLNPVNSEITTCWVR